MITSRIFVRTMCVAPPGAARKIFGKYLLITNTLTSGVLMGLGDGLQQTIEKIREPKVKPYDWQRSGRMFMAGIMLGPFVHMWYSFLDKYLPGTLKRTVAKKVLADQLLASPLFLTGFFLGTGALEGKTNMESAVELKEKFLIMYLVEWFFWPPAQTVNFLFIKPQFRVLYVNSLILLWDCFLSYMKHKPLTGLSESTKELEELTSNALTLLKQQDKWRSSLIMLKDHQKLPTITKIHSTGKRIP